MGNIAEETCFLSAEVGDLIPERQMPAHMDGMAVNANSDLTSLSFDLAAVIAKAKRSALREFDEGIATR
jgi:hypothetical protein